METGIFIRAEVNGKWDNYDIGDKAVSDVQVLKWMRESAKQHGNEYLERVILILLYRSPVIATPGVVV